MDRGRVGVRVRKFDGTCEHAGEKWGEVEIYARL